MFAVFKKIKKNISGKGLDKIPLVTKIYSTLYQRLKPEGIVLVEVDNRKMYVDSKDKYFAPLLMLNGIYAPFETLIFKQEVSEGMNVIDIGAHWGYYTTLAAELVGENGKVFAFEPNPHNYSLLVKNIEANEYNNVIATQKAISDKIEATKLFLAPGNSGDHRIYDTNEGRNFIEVETISLDEFFKDRNEKIDLIKIDTQGAEMAVIKGMNSIIKKNPKLKIITEFWPISLRKFGCSPEEYLSKLIKYGFQLFYIDEYQKKIEPVDIDRCMQICSGETHINLLCDRASENRN